MPTAYRNVHCLSQCPLLIAISTAYPKVHTKQQLTVWTKRTILNVKTWRWWRRAEYAIRDFCERFLTAVCLYYAVLTTDCETQKKKVCRKQKNSDLSKGLIHTASCSALLINVKTLNFFTVSGSTLSSFQNWARKLFIHIESFRNLLQTLHKKTSE